METKPKPTDVDVTDQFADVLADLPVPPINTFLSGDDVMKEAEDRSYLGRLTENEAKQYVTRSVLVPYETDMLLGMLAEDDRFDYDSKAEVIRHAIQMLVTYYKDNKGFIEANRGLASDIVRKQNAIRYNAQRARARNQLRDDIMAFDDEMDRARSLNDFIHIAKQLTNYQDFLRESNTETQKQLFRDTLAGSMATQSAVAAFHKWTHDPYRIPTDVWEDEWVRLSEDWSKWYQDQQEVLQT